jgi:hypothetical protein
MTCRAKRLILEQAAGGALRGHLAALEAERLRPRDET